MATNWCRWLIRKKNGGILDRINVLRRQMARDLGMIVPPLRVRDNLQLGANQYVIKIRGQDVAKGELFRNAILLLTLEQLQSKLME